MEGGGKMTRVVVRPYAVRLPESGLFLSANLVGGTSGPPERALRLAELDTARALAALHCGEVVTLHWNTTERAWEATPVEGSAR